MHCSKCGHQLPSDSQFCQYCGVRLDCTPANEDTNNVDISSLDITAAKALDSKIVCSSDIITQNAELLLHAYKSYLSEDTEEKLFWESVRGSEELRVAYLEESERTKKECDNGIRISYKQTYLDFLSILHDEYSEKSIALTPVFGSPEMQSTLPVMTQKVSKEKNSQRYCKMCGQAIDHSMKRCTGCGKQYRKGSLWPLYALFAIFLSVGLYVGANYFCAVSSMNKQEFTKSKQFFDNLFVSSMVFPNKYTYVEAGVLMEEGKYVESLRAFNLVSRTPVPVEIKDSLKSKIYSTGQAQYRAGKMEEAKKNFMAIGNYKRSKDYLFLISCCSTGSSSEWLQAKANYKELVALLGFEDADEIILKNRSMLSKFLKSRWEDGNIGSYFFEMYEDTDGAIRCRFNLPRKHASGYYYISNGIYSVGEDEASSVKLYRFTIIDEDTILVYCYKDGSTHKLYRQ